MSKIRCIKVLIGFFVLCFMSTANAAIQDSTSYGYDSAPINVQDKWILVQSDGIFYAPYKHIPKPKISCGDNGELVAVVRTASHMLYKYPGYSHSVSLIGIAVDKGSYFEASNGIIEPYNQYYQYDIYCHYKKHVAYIN